ncbi:hypothetical protein GGQ80_002072 [Sphingomonas jinjuensis]|uniref:DUF2806 domain-containing protein n=1 Tax=Sphingomonas jinjuensis TaxID=535907 RepID=A0A840FBY8_9SPHN|nr:DUF2806 domain-containing protein [Sphingomonas jinjuensis]MBB4154162.1 hypothetical protein [Sphingomonas jinjuensis]
MLEIFWGIVKVKAPAAAESVLRITGIKLLGAALEWPEAWLKDKAQDIRDRTDAKSAFRTALAKAASEAAIAEPDRVAAMADYLMEGAAATVANQAAVLGAAAHRLGEATDDELRTAEVPDDDWMAAFRRHSGEAYSSELRDAFGRLLAGEILKKGSFSRRTLRVLSEMDQQTAQVFQRVYAATIDGWIPKDRFKSDGFGFADLALLRDAGLMNAGEGYLKTKPPADNPEAKRATLKVGTLEAAFDWSHMKFTPFIADLEVVLLTDNGEELGRILPPPDIDANTLAIAHDLQSEDFIVSITIDGQPFPLPPKSG